MANNLLNRNNLNLSRLNVDQLNQLLGEVTAQAELLKFDEEVNNTLLIASQEFATAYITFHKDMQDVLNKLNNYDQIRDEYNHLMQAEDANMDEAEEIIKKYRDAHDLLDRQVRLARAKQIGQAIVSAQEKYENILNSFIGHHMKITYTTQVQYDAQSQTYSGGNVYVFEDNNDYSAYMQYGFHLNKASQKYYFHSIKYDFDRMLRDCQDLMMDATERYRSDPNLSNYFNNLRHTRLSAERRFDISAQYQVIKNSSFRGLILWKTHKPEWRVRRSYSGWAGLWVRERSNIAEAYAAVIATEKLKQFNMNDIYALLDVFIGNFLMKVDSLAGAIFGDVAKKNIEYAIKSIGGGLSGLDQFYTDYAAPILRKENLYDKQKLLEYYRTTYDTHPGLKTALLTDNLEEISNRELGQIIHNVNTAVGSF